MLDDDQFLKLNDDKTDLLIIGSHTSLSKIPTTVVNIGNHNNTAASSQEPGCNF